MHPKRAETTKRFPAQRPDGTRQCVWCAKERPPKATWRTWCSAACTEDYKIRAWPAHAAKVVAKRDSGVCASCGIDTEKLKAWLQKMPRKIFLTPGATLGRSDRFALANHNGRMLGRHQGRAMTLLGRLWGCLVTPARHLYEVDHIKPVAEGGGGCGLDNLRTLCLRCHRLESKALHKRLREKKKGDQSC